MQNICLKANLWQINFCLKGMTFAVSKHYNDKITKNLSSMVLPLLKNVAGNESADNRANDERIAYVFDLLFAYFRGKGYEELVLSFDEIIMHCLSHQNPGLELEDAVKEFTLFRYLLQECYNRYVDDQETLDLD